MKAAIHKFAASNEYYFEEGCHINELYNTPDDQEMSVVSARVLSGEITRWHRLQGISERYVIQSGSGSVEVEGLPATTVVPGDVVIIPPGAGQRIRNSGSEDLVFLAICTPRFTPQAYEDIES